ncbi:MAG: hypothetical protein JST42_01745 [Bacteroidetes bacterium]|nr:hypothetical protein [Bacteroidota bacterium]
MELDNLKVVWQVLEDPLSRGRRPGDPAAEVHAAGMSSGRESLLPLLQQRSRGPVARMRRNLRIELLCIIVAYIPLILFYLVEFQGRLRAISLLLILVGALFCAYYYRKSRLLTTMQCPACQVRSNLARQVGTLKRYTRFYLLASTIVIPAMAILTYAIFHLRLFYPGDGIVYHRLSPAPWWASPTLWLLMLVPLTVGMYYFNAWYINRLYGRHIKKLQELLREMDEE